MGWGSWLLFLPKIIRIDLLDYVALGFGDADIVLDHQVGEFFAVDEDDLLFDAGYIVKCLLREAGSSHQHTFAGADAI